MAVDSQSSGVADELQLLRCMYDTSELSVSESAFPPMTVQLRARPYVAANEGHIFCSIDATATLDIGYPNVPARVVFSHSRGFDDAQLSALRNDVLEMAAKESAQGVVHLFELLSKIREKVTELNKPNPCPVCCEKIRLDALAGNACVRLQPCWHAMHGECFMSYLEHRRVARDDKEVHLRTTLGNFGAREKAYENWMCCPICRVSVDYESASETASAFINTANSATHMSVGSKSENL